MKLICLLTMKHLVVALGASVLLIQVFQMPVLATQTQSEKVEAISELAAEINYFYLHPNATDFMNSFYTRESYEHLRETFNQVQERKVPGWVTELDMTELTELYQLLDSAVTNLRPHIVRRGEATAQGQNLNFRALPQTETQVFHTLTYGTSFEILQEVQGGIVIGNDLVSDARWFRIRHNNQPGYVHARYVRDLPVSEERIGLLADIGRQELRIQAKIDGWRTDFSPDTQQELQKVLSTARALQIENWQFNFSYSELNQVLESLSYEHLNLITLSRYHLISNIVALKDEIENNIQGDGNARIENYTEASWGKMDAALTEARGLLNEDWESNLSDEDLEYVHELLRSVLDGLEFIPQPEQVSDDESDLVDRNLDQIIIFGTLALIGFTALLITLKVIKLIKHRKFNE